MLSSMVKPYGFFTDELYFIACSKRLYWGFVDQPPLSIALLTFITNLFGYGILIVRILPALSTAATVFVAGMITKRLGGSTMSIIIAELAIMVVPVFQIFGSFYSMNAYEPLVWALIMFFVVKMVQEDNTVYWLHIGVLMGIGLEMKHTIVLYGIALLFGMLLTSKRKLLFNKWAIWGGIACFILILPNLVWQYANDFPSLELYRNSFLYKNIDKPYLQVFIEQVIFINPATFLLWFTGLVYLLTPAGKNFRFLFFAYILLLLIMMAGHSSRPDRIASIYILLIVFGVIAIDKIRKASGKLFAQISITILLLISGVILTPIFCPVLPPAKLKPYIASLGLSFNLEEGKKNEPVPQWLADRIGWEQLAEDVLKVYQSLPEKERENSVIVSSNYGEAGALELYGPKYGLPKVYATHNSFHSWGPPPDWVKTFIGVYIDVENVKDKFDSIEVAAVYHCAECTKPQQEIPIYILRGPKFSIQKEWNNFKMYR